MAQTIQTLYSEISSLLQTAEESIADLTQQMRSQQADLTEVRDRMAPLLTEKLAPVEKDLRAANTYLTMAQRKCGAFPYEPTPQSTPCPELQRMFATARNRTDFIDLYILAANAVAYLQLQKELICKEHEADIARALNTPAAQATQAKIDQLRSQQRSIAGSPQMQALAEAVRQAEANYGHIAETRLPEKTDDAFYLGDQALPLPLENADEAMLSAFGDRWNGQQKTLRLPILFPTESRADGINYAPFKLQLTYSNAMAAQSYQFVQGLVYNILVNYDPLPGRVTLLDLDTYNSEYLGVLEPLAGPESMILFPEDPKAADNALTDIEDAAYSDPENARKHRFLIVRGLGTGSGSSLAEKLLRICRDGRKNNISVIFLDRQADDSRNTIDRRETYDITLCAESRDNGFVDRQTGHPLLFPSAPTAIDSDAMEDFKQAYTPEKRSNAYENFFSLDASAVNYTRKRNKIRLPYAMDRDGNVLSMVFEGMEFASFIMGGSGSGKSTLIHALITSIVRNYHPDEVELWLADFKMVTFSKYIRHMPPHVKYILMDESAELIRDFVDKIYEEMLRRETALSSLGFENRRDLPLSKYMPAIFVIFDEFSILSSVLSTDEVYRDRLQQIMVKGRATGFRFIFSSQKFTAGAAALTSTAREQIGSRLVMRGEKQEMRDTLAVPGSQNNSNIQRAIDTLPPYYTLNLRQQGDGSYTLDRGMALYFPGDNDEAWVSRAALFDALRTNYRPVSEEQYDPNLLDQYVDKHPVVVNRSELFVFEPARFRNLAQTLRNDPNNLIFDDDILVSFGTPRRLEEASLATLTTEACENILLLASDRELACGMSVLLSTVRSFLAQKCDVQVWAYQRNRIYHTYRQDHFSKLDVRAGAEAVWDAIDHLVADIKAGKHNNQLIVLLGMENLVNQFSSGGMLSSKSIASTATPSFSNLTATTAEEQQAAAACLSDEQILWDMYEELCEKGEAAGKTDEQIDAEYQQLVDQYWQNKFQNQPAVAPVPTPVEQPPEPAVPHLSDPLGALQALLREGSNYGCHFLVCLNNYAALRTLGIQIDRFNHRLAFKTDAADTSAAIFNSSVAFRLAEHICQYAAFGSSGGQYSLSPYLHRGVVWDNWTVTPDGKPDNGLKK